MLLVDQFRLQVAHLQLESDDLVLGKVKLALNFVNILLAGHFALKRADLRSFAEFIFEGVNLLLVQELLFAGLLQRLLNREAFFLFVQ